MSRKLDFRNNIDVKPAGIVYEVFYVFFCVVVRAVFLTVVCFLYGRAFHKLRVLVYGDAPTLVVGQVQMQTVHFKHCHDIELPFQIVYTEEMSARVDHQSAIAEPRAVGNIYAWNR